MKSVKEALEALAESVAPYNEKAASYLRGLNGQTPQQIADDLSLWGGAGSLMDEGVFGEGREVQRLFESNAIALGHALKDSGAASTRMDQWLGVFESWARNGA